MTGRFDGHANCFVESGDGKGLLIDFNYDTEPLPGDYPLPGLGPFRLLEETRINHWASSRSAGCTGTCCCPADPIPLPAHMSMAGKHPPTREGGSHACDHHRRPRQSTSTPKAS